MHCHVEFHSESGMALIFKVGNEADLPAAPADWPQCGNFGKIDEPKNFSDPSRNKLSFMLYFLIFCLYLILYL